MELDVRRCEYCGAPLSSEFYFCQNCSRPYTKVEFVLPKVSTPYLSDRARVEMLAPGALKIFWLYLGVLLGIAILGIALFGMESASTSFSVFASLAFAAVTLVVTVWHFDTLKPQLLTTGLGHPASWLGLPLLFGCLLVNYFYHVLFLNAIGLGEMAQEEPSYTEIFAGYGSAVFFVAVLPAITEEIACRGLIQHWLQQALPPARAIAFAAFLFAISHFSAFSLPYLFLIGLLLGWLKWKTGSLFPSIGVHFLHNWAVITWME